MPLHHLQHFLIQTADLAGTVRWYVDVLGLREGPHPDFKFPVAWLYIGETDVLHLTEGGAAVSANRMAFLGQQSQATQGTGVVDHVAFRATKLKDTIEHLRARNIAFKTRQVSGQGLFQIFVLDPNGVKIELNFDNALTEGVVPELRATELYG